jgi:YVTN family beta-propeller protein
VSVTAETSNSVSVIDARARRVVGNFLVDIRPRSVAFSPDGRRAYVTAEIGSTLSVIDLVGGKVEGTVELERGRARPVGVVVARDGTVYVANGGANTVSVVEPLQMKVVATIPVGRRPWNLALSRDGAWLVTANGQSDDVSVVDTRIRRVVSTVKVGRRPWGVALVQPLAPGDTVGNLRASRHARGRRSHVAQISR